jgi:hypothetical protein
MKQMANISHALPSWLRTIGAIQGSNALVRSQCRICGIQLREDPRALAAIFGPMASLVNRTIMCRVVGCHGRAFFSAAKTFGRQWLVLADREDFLDHVKEAVDPVNAVTLGVVSSRR